MRDLRLRPLLLAALYLRIALLLLLRPLLRNGPVFFLRALLLHALLLGTLLLRLRL